MAQLGIQQLLSAEEEAQGIVARAREGMLRHTVAAFECIFRVKLSLPLSHTPWHDVISNIFEQLRLQC